LISDFPAHQTQSDTFYMAKRVLELAMCVFNRADFVEIGAAGIAAFHRIGIGDLKVRIEDNPPTAFLGHVFIFILGVHVVLAEGASIVVELGAVQG
jgi:hypothetical protein